MNLDAVFVFFGKLACRRFLGFLDRHTYRDEHNFSAHE